jgi:hypothetical protein
MLLENYAKENDKILDAFRLWSIAQLVTTINTILPLANLIQEYYNKAIERINNHVAQQNFFSEKTAMQRGRKFFMKQLSYNNIMLNKIKCLI